MVKEPTIQVPVSVFLDLVRVYKEEPQELVNRTTYLTSHMLERKATRKYREYRKALRDEAKS